MLKMKKQDEKSTSPILSINPKFKVGDEVFVSMQHVSETRVHWQILGPVEICKIEASGFNSANECKVSVSYRFHELSNSYTEEYISNSLEEIVEKHNQWRENQSK